MTPTVGRAVHFYGIKTLWHEQMELGRHSDLAKYNGFNGPFHATIVFVHADGTVNLSIGHPVPASRGYDVHYVTSSIVCDVPFSERALNEHWTWPPRV